MNIEIAQLEWDQFNSNHIREHKVNEEEILEACRNQIDTLDSYGRRKMLFGKTDQGRYLTIILANTKLKNQYYVVTARDISRKERKYVQTKEK